MQSAPDELSVTEQILKSLPRASPPGELRERILAQAGEYLEAERRRRETRWMVFAAACIFLVCLLLAWTQRIRLNAAGPPPRPADLADMQRWGRQVPFLRGDLDTDEAVHEGLGIPLGLP